MLFLMNIFDYLPSSDVKFSSEWGYIFGLCLVVIFTLISGVLYGLGWKKKIFSIKAVNIIKAFFSLILGCYFVVPLISEYQNLVNTPNLLPIFVFINMVIVFLLLFLFASPVILLGFISIHKYKKYFDKSELFQKPYLKLASLFFILSYLANLIGIFVLKFNHLIIYNVWDYLIELSLVYQGIFLIGYVFEKKIFNRLFWKISSFIYVPCFVISNFLMSDSYSLDTYHSQTGLMWSYNIISVIIFIFFVYVLYNYAFTNQIFKSDK